MHPELRLSSMGSAQGKQGVDVRSSPQIWLNNPIPESVLPISEATKTGLGNELSTTEVQGYDGTDSHAEQFALFRSTQDSETPQRRSSPVQLQGLERKPA